MVTYYLGLQGSGKTYGAVYTIFNNFSKSDLVNKTLKKDYINCYTNIDSFKFDRFDNVFKFDFDDFHIHILKLFHMYKKEKASDDLLVEYCKKHNIYKTLFVIDECHYIFDVVKPELVWWITYHRHLFHDIILITQLLSLVNAKYKVSEIYYKARPQSLILSSKVFKYSHFCDSRMSAKSKVGTVKIPKLKEVFDLYTSGDSVKNKNVILKFILIALFFLVLLFSFGFYYYYSQQQKINNVKDSKSTFKSKTSLNNKSISSSESFDYSDNILMIFKCNNEMCTYDNYYFNVKVLAFAKDNFDLHIISMQRVFSYDIVTVSVAKMFLNFIQGAQNEDFKDDSVSIPTLLGK